MQIQFQIAKTDLFFDTWGKETFPDKIFKKFCLLP
jgi:hypothetical protein